MSYRIGLEIGTENVRALAVRGTRVLWAAEADVHSMDTLAHHVTLLLRSMPKRRWRRSVVVALGPTLAQLRRVSGLPALTNQNALGRIVREGVSRFFPTGPHPLITSGVRLVEPGRVWAAAFDEPAVLAAVEGCAGAGLRITGVVPSLAVLRLGLEGDELHWPDGSVLASVRFCDGQLESVRTVMVTGDQDPFVPPEAKQPLSAIGNASWRFAAAYGAAILPASESLMLRPGRELLEQRDVPSWRIALAACTFTAAAVATLLAGPMRMARMARESEERLVSVTEARHAVDVTRAELQRFTAALDAVNRFGASRISVLLLLADLSRALPERSALVALQIDSIGGTLVMLTPRTGPVVAALETITTITNLEIIGPVTQEEIDGQGLERVNIRFRMAAGLPSLKQAERRVAE